MAAFYTARRILAGVVIGALAVFGAVVGAATVASASTVAYGNTPSAGQSESSPVGIRGVRSEWTPVRSMLAAPSNFTVSAAATVPTAASSAQVARVVSGDFLSLRAVRLEAISREAARLKAEDEAAAAARAVAVAAAQAATQAAATQAATQEQARAAAGFVTNVWTSGFQAQINQCRGAVDVTAVYRVRVIAEHSSCGGNRFPTAAGSIVTITGLDAGRYRVIGVVARLNGLVDHAEDLPRGYDLLFQTCAAGFTDMRFTALSRIG